MRLERYEAYKDSGVKWIGEVPEEWEVKKLKYISDIKTGYTPDTTKINNFSNNGIVWVKPDNLKEFFPIYNSKERISLSAIKNKNIIPKNSILVNCIGTIGKFGIAGVDLITNQQINAVTFNLNIAINFGKYLIFISNHEHNRYSNGNVVQILNTTAQGGIFLPVPSLHEQTKIANFLDQKTTQINKAISLKEKLIEKLKEYRQILINDAVTKGLDKNVKMRDSGVKWIGEVPEGWEVKRLKYIFDKMQTGTTPSTANMNFFNGNINWFNPKDLNQSILKNSEKKVSLLAINRKEIKFFQGDSILIVGIGATIGKTSYLLHKATFNQQITGFKSFKNNNKYMFYSLKNSSIIFLKIANYTTLPILNNEFFKTYILPLPTLHEQTKIANFLDQKTAQIDKAIKQQRKQIDKLKEYKASLIDSVVTGKVRVL